MTRQLETLRECSTRVANTGDIDGIAQVRPMVASTREGIRAAERLERGGIHCQLSLRFSFAQAVGCAEAGVFLISPFARRSLDWQLAHGMATPATAQDDDPGVQSGSRIWQHGRRHRYATVVMGASFRNTGAVLALAGCDRLAISPGLLAALEPSKDDLERGLWWTLANAPRRRRKPQCAGNTKMTRWPARIWPQASASSQPTSAHWKRGWRSGRAAA